MVDRHRSPLWTVQSEVTAIRAADAFSEHRARKAQERADTFQSTPALHAGGDLYDASRPAPKHNGILYGALLVIWGLGMIVLGIRRLRQPWSACVLLVIVALVALGIFGGR